MGEGGRRRVVSKEQMKTKLGRSRNEREGQGQRKPPTPPFALYQVHCRQIARIPHIYTALDKYILKAD